MISADHLFVTARTRFRSTGQEAAVALIKAADLLRRELARVVEAHDVTLQQFNVLRILRGQRGALPTLEIASRMVEQTPGITRLLDRLEARSLVKRARCTEDRRQVLCTITESGLSLLAGLDRPFAAAEERLLRLLPAADLPAFVRAAATFDANARKSASPSRARTPVKENK